MAFVVNVQFCHYPALFPFHLATTMVAGVGAAMVVVTVVGVLRPASPPRRLPCPLFCYLPR
ncbi:hypothetical protein PIB30_099656, partial [Stylosanthes scabra]|nr:hypothetical protein [Stylosanthes scabra]